MVPYFGQLGARNMKGTGTIRENRIPECPLKRSSDLKVSDRGTFDYSLVDDDIVICKWNDNSVVTLASNASAVFPLHNAKRFSKSEKKHIYISQPSIIKSYNENMGGVDRSDQNIGQYRTTIRGKKWYFPLIAHCVDMAVQNACHLHKQNGGILDQLSFRRAIAIMSYWKPTKKRPNVVLQEHQKACMNIRVMTDLII
nr:unnamed protein product [Callosobruchus analis]